MSNLKLNNIQIGFSNTQSNNFLFTVPDTPNGTLKLARGIIGLTTQDIMTVASDGNVTFPTGVGTVGEIAAFARSSAPAGWVKCNGAALSRITYANLFSIIGTSFGAGDGSTTFNVPDLRGEFIRGWDDGRGADSGRTFGSWQKGSILGGEDVYPGNSVNVPIIAGDQAKWGYDNPRDSWTTGLYLSVAAHGGDYYVTDSGPNSSGYQMHAGVSRPRNLALLFCIKY